MDRTVAGLTFERDERYWYGEGWTRLRRNLVRLCLQESGDLLYVLCWDAAGPDEVDEAVQVFVDRMVASIQKRLDAMPNADIWRHSLRLLAWAERLGLDLQRQQARFAATDCDADPQAMLGTTLRSHFEMMRRELQTEHSPHRLKVWEQIDRVSREILDVNDDPQVVRSVEHLEAVLLELRARYPNSRNLPRSIGTLESYFVEFSRSYRHGQWNNEFDGVIADERTMNMADLAFLEEVTGMKPDPIQCFRQLPEAHGEAFAVAHRLQADLMPDSTPQFSSSRAYFLNLGISKRQFYRLVREATDLLIKCLERKI